MISPSAGRPIGAVCMPGRLILAVKYQRRWPLQRIGRGVVAALHAVLDDLASGLVTSDLTHRAELTKLATL
jgi:hypothetical protein